MRFTWVALPVLLTALAPSSQGAAAPEESADEPATPWTVVDLDVARPSETPEPPLESEAIAPDPLADGSSSVSADVHLRVIRVASLDFSTRVSHSVSGFLPSYSTACPPPAA